MYVRSLTPPRAVKSPCMWREIGASGPSNTSIVMSFAFAPVNEPDWYSSASCAAFRCSQIATRPPAPAPELSLVVLSWPAAETTVVSALLNRLPVKKIPPPAP